SFWDAVRDSPVSSRPADRRRAHATRLESEGVGPGERGQRRNRQPLRAGRTAPEPQTTAPTGGGVDRPASMVLERDPTAGDRIVGPGGRVETAWDGGPVREGRRGPGGLPPARGGGGPVPLSGDAGPEGRGGPARRPGLEWLERAAAEGVRPTLSPARLSAAPLAARPDPHDP